MAKIEWCTATRKRNCHIPEAYCSEHHCTEPESFTRRDDLLLRYRDGTILPHEREELLGLLEAEREEAKKKNDIAILIPLGLLIAALIATSRSK